MRVYGGGSGRCDCRGVCFNGGLLIFLVLFAQAAFSGLLVNRPSHVVLTPMEGIVTMLLFFGFTIFRWDLSPCFVLLLSLLITCILLVSLFLNPFFAICLVLVICQLSQLG
jgi:hypothetical protein